jgi:hypothetical protein
VETPAAMIARFLDQIPMWAFFALTCLVTLVAMEVGVWMGSRRRRRVEMVSQQPTIDLQRRLHGQAPGGAPLHQSPIPGRPPGH